MGTLIKTGKTRYYPASTPTQILFDTSTAGGSGGSEAGNTWTWNHTCGAGATYLFVDVECNNNNVSGVTYNGMAMAALASVVKYPGANLYISTWGLLNPGTGTHAVLVSLGTSATTVGGNSSSYIGASMVVGTGTGTVTAGTALSATVSGSPASPDWEVAAIIQNESVTAPGGWFGRQTGGNPILYDSNGPTNLSTVTFTLGGSGDGAIAVVALGV